MTSLSLFKNYFKKFICLFLLSFFHLNIVLAESDLPKCKGEDYTKWKNCFGTILNTDVTKEVIENYIKSGRDQKLLPKMQKTKWTTDYTGEFGSVPGKREGKGSLKLYSNGKLHSTLVGEYINDKTTGSAVISYVKTGEYVGEIDENGMWNGQGTFTSDKGDKFVGEFKNSNVHGLAVATYANNEEYIGEWKDFNWHGQGTYTWNDGDKYIGEWRDNLQEGIGTYKWIDGAIYIGEWKDNQRSGQGTYTDKHGREVYSGNWENNMWHGIGKMTNTDGSTYVGEFKRDKFHGQGTYTWADGSKHIGEWKDGNRHGKGTYISKEGYSEEVNFVEDKKVPLESEKPKKKEIDLKKEREKLEAELKKLEEEKNKAKKVADKKKKIKEQHEKFYYDAYEIEEARGIQYAQQFLKDLQEFIKKNPKEFDILEITELMIDNKLVLEGIWKSENIKNFNSLFNYVMKSKSFHNYYEDKFFERIEMLIVEYDSEVKTVEDNIDFLKKYLQDNLTSKAAEKIVIQVRKTEKVFSDPTLDNLKKINKETNQFIKSLNNKKNKTKNTKIKKDETKYKSISEKKSTIKGSPKEKIINILKESGFNYRDIEFSRNEDDFIIYNIEIDGQTIEKVEVEGLNEIYLEGIFEFITKGEKTDYFDSYSGKYFDKIKISGISNFVIGGSRTSVKEIAITDLDFRKFDIIKKLINPIGSINEAEKNLISYMMSMSFDEFYIDDIICKFDNEYETFKYDYFEISDFKELAINKLLIKNASFISRKDEISFEEILLEKLILDDAEILAFLNSDRMKYGFATDFSSYIQNGIKSLRKFEINEFSTTAQNKKALEFNSFEFNNIKFDYLGDHGGKKVPINFEIDVDAADFNFKSIPAFEYLDIAENLKYDAIKFDFGAEWNWNTRRNNLLINLDLGITDAASIKLKSSFVDLSTDVLNLTGFPLGTYLMTQPKIKSFNLSLKDHSLKNRLIDFLAKEENMSSDQYKDFIAQSLKIFIATLGSNNVLLERMHEAVTNFIYDSDNITLSAKPSQPLSITDLMPDFQEANANKIITKLNLKISNNLF